MLESKKNIAKAQPSYDWEESDVQTCNVVRGTQILCKLEHEVEGDTTFFYTEHNLQMHVFCIVSHGGKGPSLSDNEGIGSVENDIEMHAPEDQAFSLAANINKEIMSGLQIRYCATSLAIKSIDVSYWGIQN